jgi:16S rRNA (guanine966-N2)-methyltransferase
VRIIGGTWKRTPLAVPPVAGLRPTPDRVRETVFNWIVHQRGGSLAGARVLDLFAGSGALGFESASRGAAAVILVERAREALAALDELRTRLSADQVEVWPVDVLAALARLTDRGSQFDVVFVDPPYHEGWLERVVPLINPLLAADGLLYVEAECALTGEESPYAGLELLRADKAGQVFYHLLRPKAATVIAENS